jgi:hypothetical protein
MDEKVLTAFIGAVAGLISGSIASLIAPWVNWQIEQRKQKLNHRRELIAKWRTMIFQVVSFYENNRSSEVQSFFDLFATEPDYLSLKPHISKEAFEKLNETDITPGTIIIEERGTMGSGLTKINSIDYFAAILANEVTRIENEWNLI